MALLSVIRRWHFRQQIPIREIERRTGLSRNTIRKYLRADVVEPKFKLPDRPSKLDPFAEKLAGWLRQEASKSRKHKRTTKQLHADLVVLGYEGSYGRVAAFVRYWKADRQREQQTTGRGTFVPLVFAAGEAFQFDWSEDWAVVAGERTKLQVAHTKLSHSRVFIVRGYLLQTHEMLFDALAEAFRVLGGVPQRGIFDNMKTAVDKIGSGKARQVNARFAAMASHYLFETDFCNPASGWEKGQIEKNVQDARRRLWQPLPSFPDLAALNAWLEARCIEQWGEIQHGVLPGTIADVHAAEVASLMPLGRPFDGFVEHTKRLSPTCLVNFERNRYSVPASFANRPVGPTLIATLVGVAALLARPLAGQAQPAAQWFDVQSGFTAVLLPADAATAPLMPDPAALIQQMNALLTQAEQNAAILQTQLVSMPSPIPESGVIITTISDGSHSYTERITYPGSGSQAQVQLTSTANGCALAGLERGTPAVLPRAVPHQRPRPD